MTKREGCLVEEDEDFQEVEVEIEIEALWKEIDMKKDLLKKEKFAKEVSIKKIVVGSRGSHNVTIVRNLGIFRKIVDSKIKNNKM